MSGPEVSAILLDLEELPQPLRTPGMRSVARSAARRMKEQCADNVLSVADELIELDEPGTRMVAFELVYRHRHAREALDGSGWSDWVARWMDGLPLIALVGC